MFSTIIDFLSWNIKYLPKSYLISELVADLTGKGFPGSKTSKIGQGEGLA